MRPYSELERVMENFLLLLLNESRGSEFDFKVSHSVDLPWDVCGSTLARMVPCALESDGLGCEFWLDYLLYLKS